MSIDITVLSTLLIEANNLEDSGERFDNSAGIAFEWRECEH